MEEPVIPVMHGYPLAGVYPLHAHETRTKHVCSTHVYQVAFEL